MHVSSSGNKGGLSPAPSDQKSRQPPSASVMIFELPEQAHPSAAPCLRPDGRIHRSSTTLSATCWCLPALYLMILPPLRCGERHGRAAAWDASVLACGSHSRRPGQGGVAEVAEYSNTNAPAIVQAAAAIGSRTNPSSCNALAHHHSGIKARRQQ